MFAIRWQPPPTRRRPLSLTAQISEALETVAGSDRVLTLNDLDSVSDALSDAVWMHGDARAGADVPQDAPPEAAPLDEGELQYA